MPDQPLVIAMRDLISAIMHADVAVKDWGLGYAEVDFQEAILRDFRGTLDRLAGAVGSAEIVGTVRARLDFQRRSDMAVLYDVSPLEAKPPLLWSADVLSQFVRFGLYDPGSADEVPGAFQPLIAAVKRDSYAAWRAAEWPYPSR